jgi:hypothetical protein
MLVYLLGDVLRIFSGDFAPGEIGGKAMPPIVWLGAAIVMLIPIVMMLVNVFWADQNIVYANISQHLHYSCLTRRVCQAINPI